MDPQTHSGGWSRTRQRFCLFAALTLSAGTCAQPLEKLVAAPLPERKAGLAPSPVIREIAWAPRETIVRQARGSDNWPLTWADDNDLYTAYGDGNGFEPGRPQKLSIGFGKVSGFPPDFTGANLPSPSGEQLGDGVRGLKASGLLMVEGVLYLWTRNATNSQLAWSRDHAKTWTWCDWRLTNSFGCPTFLNHGRDYAGAPDGFVYVYSHDNPSAYNPADRFVLARVPKDRITHRDAYRFFQELDAGGQPIWTDDIERRGGVLERPGQCYRSGVTFNAPLNRYLWCQTVPGTDARFRGGFSVCDAPEPWGPWTEAFATSDWDTGPGETSSFPSKWMSADGKSLWLVFSGEDSFSARQARIVLRDPVQAPNANERLRVIIETDAGGDPDDEQSLVRFLLYANEWDVEGIIATDHCPQTRRT